jgi:hypothetical protein
MDEPTAAQIDSRMGKSGPDGVLKIQDVARQQTAEGYRGRVGLSVAQISGEWNAV